MKKLVCALALLSVLAMPQHLIAAAAQETLESTISDLLQVLKNKTEEGTPEYQQQREELVRIIDKIFAFDELSAGRSACIGNGSALSNKTRSSSFSLNFSGISTWTAFSHITMNA